MLEEMISKNRPRGCDLYIMYDIACILHKHLQVRICYTMAARGLRVVHECKPRVCNPVDHKQSHRITYLYDDIRDKL